MPLSYWAETGQSDTKIISDAHNTVRFADTLRVTYFIPIAINDNKGRYYNGVATGRPWAVGFVRKLQDEHLLRHGTRLIKAEEASVRPTVLLETIERPME